MFNILEYFIVSIIHKNIILIFLYYLIKTNFTKNHLYSIIGRHMFQLDKIKSNIFN